MHARAFTLNFETCKGAERILRTDYECRVVQIEQEEIQDHTMNVEACEDSRMNFRIKLLMCKRAKSKERISRPDYEV